jgi:hypothetical protein
MRDVCSGSKFQKHARNGGRAGTSAMHSGPAINIVNAGIAQNSGPWQIEEAVAAERP